jgi:hypothetical protein
VPDGTKARSVDPRTAIDKIDKIDKTPVRPAGRGNFVDLSHLSPKEI